MVMMMSEVYRIDKIQKGSSELEIENPSEPGNLHIECNLVTLSQYAIKSRIIIFGKINFRC